MSTLVESLRRLYKQDKITLEKLEEMVSKGTITVPDLEYIIA